ncbi:MAG: acyl-CoA dehydratase activase [Pseudomonadota bacterium]
MARGRAREQPAVLLEGWQQAMRSSTTLMADTSTPKMQWLAPDLWVGIDVGSVTVKIAVLDPSSRELLHADYARHNAEQALTAKRLLEDAHTRFPGKRLAVAVCGSAGDIIAEHTGAFFVQEVVANAIAVRELYPRARVAIELGGQDAKVVFFTHDERTGQLVASDMRMNGSCAGGTGAFIDQMAELLGVKIENFNALASRGHHVYDISGRCGVFAKTDIQPLLNQCVAKEDIALSVFHALAKQTIGGLVQGMTITPPVIFEGGPLTFHRRLIEVFIERLGLGDDDVILPERPEIVVACGAALSVGTLFADRPPAYDPTRLASLAQGGRRSSVIDFESLPFFASDDDKIAFDTRHALPDFVPREVEPGTTLPVYLGIDAGSTTSKFVLLDEEGALVDRYYAGNQGDPLRVVQQALIDMRERYVQRGVTLDIRGVGTTGYGEQLFARAFKADLHTVETVAHAEAAMAVDPRVSFILDIGGQDMKAIRVGDGIVTGITLNEACSAGCGSFVETFARSMGVQVEAIAPLAFSSHNPSRLGSRCTVFMNSSVITEQKNGKTPADILAGVTRSIVENVFTKVVRVANFDQLGEVVFAQGGTFKNDAVLRSFEQYCGRTVIRPPHPGEMGAIGVALLTRKHVRELESLSGERQATRFIGLEALDAFAYEKLAADVCPFCTNSCSRSRILFSDGSEYVTGNRCERGEVFGNPKDQAVLAQVREANARMKAVPDLTKLRDKLLFKNYQPALVAPRKDQRIGLPRVLEFFNSMPFWSTLFRALGFDVVLSRKSDYKLFEDGLHSVPSDTICFPAKLAHGHVRDLIARQVDRIFMPMMVKIPTENASTKGVHTCAVIQGYPVIIAESDEPESRHGVPFDRPIFHWYTRALRDRQIADDFCVRYGVTRAEVKKAIALADAAVAEMQRTLIDEGQKVLSSLEGTEGFAVVLAGRPYHNDALVNHDLSSHFTRHGVPVLTIDSLPRVHDTDLGKVRTETVNPFHVRMYSAAMYGARHPNLELAQIVSFGCGHDAIITDEMQRLISGLSDKQLLVLKLDEGEARGPLNIRVTSFVETVRARRHRQAQAATTPEVRALPEPFEVLFTRAERQVRTILAPNISRGFAEVITAAGKRLHYKVEPLPMADARAIELGKKYLHNDICFPAQINVGEFLALMEKGQHDPDKVVFGLAKNCDDCRAGQYAALARKALDDAGYQKVPMMTTGTDTKGMHPGFTMGPREQGAVLWGLGFMDAMDDMLRKCRPYELVPGQLDALYTEHWGNVLDGLSRSNKAALEALKVAVDAFNTVPLDRSARKPRVGIIGEILLNYHPTSNGEIVRYLEQNGMECILPSMVDFFRRDLIRIQEGAKRHHLPNPWSQSLLAGITNKIFAHMLGKIEPIHQTFRFYEAHADCFALQDNIRGFIDPTYMVGEGWLIPAEIIELYKHDVRAFVIVQPFGCLPNHITGRGLVKTMKRRCPGIQIVSLDYDPDTSFANVENRLQMLIMSARELALQSQVDTAVPRPSILVEHDAEGASVEADPVRP